MRRTLGLFFVLFAFGCTTTPADLRQSDPSVQIPSIEKSVRRKDSASEQQLVHDLRSDDPAIRFYAIQGLYRLTGKTLGYRYYDDELERMQAVVRWEGWLRERGGIGSQKPHARSRNVGRQDFLASGSRLLASRFLLNDYPPLRCTSEPA